MTAHELCNGFFDQTGDEDYQYELYRERQMDEYNQHLIEREAYEEMLADKY